MPKRVLLFSRDLTFRALLRAAAAAAGADVTQDDASCDAAVVEIDTPAWEARVRDLTTRGVPVLAFGAHVRPDLLRAARAAGAHAVPNSELDASVAALLR
jgi:hypothetical protein